MDYNKEFKKFAKLDRGISSLTLDKFTSVYSNLPTIIEKTNEYSYHGCFSRLMMDRIIFLEYQ